MNHHIRIANMLATSLDAQFHLFGIRFGMAALIDLIPGIGDMIDASLAFYIVWIAIQMELPFFAIIQMISNIAISFLLGLIPLVGDAAAYVFYKPNLKNIRILKRYSGIVEGEIVG